MYYLFQLCVMHRFNRYVLSVYSQVNQTLKTSNHVFLLICFLPTLSLNSCVTLDKLLHFSTSVSSFVKEELIIVSPKRVIMRINTAKPLELYLAQNIRWKV